MATHGPNGPCPAGCAPTDPAASPSNEAGEFYDLQPFREVFLSYFDRAERGALRQAGVFLANRIVEGWRPRFTESASAHEIRSAAADLLDLERYLRLDVAPAVDAASIGRGEINLCLKAEEWAKRIAAIAVEMQEALGPEPPEQDEQV